MPQSLKNRSRSSINFQSTESMFSYSARKSVASLDDDRYRAVSVSEKIVGSLKQANSTRYFSILARIIALYGVVKFVMILERVHYIVTAAIVCILCVGHILYHVSLLLIFKLREHSAVNSFFESGFSLFMWSVFDLIFLLPFRFAYSLGSVFHDSVVLFVRTNLNAIVTLCLFCGFAVLMVAITGFVTFKLVQEVNGILESIVAFVNYLIANSHNSIAGDDNELSQRVQAAMMDMRNYALQWGDERFKENFPAINMTLPDVYTKVYASVVNLSQLPSNTTAIATSEWWLAPLTYNKDLSLKEVFSNMLNTTNIMMNSDLRKREVVLDLFSHFMFDHLRNILLALLNAFTYAFNLSIDLTLFSFVLFSLTLNDYSFVYYASQILVVIDSNQHLRVAIERAVKAVFLSTVKMAVFHFLFTWISFSLAGIEYVYFFSVVGSIFAVVPIVSPFWICLPAIIQLIWQHRIWTMLGVLISHLWVMLWAVSFSVNYIGIVSFIYGYIVCRILLYIRISQIAINM